MLISLHRKRIVCSLFRRNSKKLRALKKWIDYIMSFKTELEKILITLDLFTSSQKICAIDIYVCIFFIKDDSQNV